MSEISSAIKQICEEKNLSYEAVLETIESALAAAYRKDYGEKNQNIKVQFDPETGKSKVYDVKTIVEDMPEEELTPSETSEEEKETEVAPVTESKEDKKPNKGKGKKKDKKEEVTEITEVKEEPVIIDEKAFGEMEEERRFNPKTEMQIKDAKAIKKTIKIGEELKIKLPAPESFGRMAAQTAKQVIIQKLREAEREMVFSEFKDKEKEVVSGVVQRRENRIVLVDLGKTVGVLIPEEQIMGENYAPGTRLKVFVREVRLSPKGPEIILSRTADEILKKIFYLEIPEISNGLIEIKGVAREAGNRSKIAVLATNDNVDPIGSCVGQRGARIQTIIHELGGEKVDIIEYSDEAEKFIANALAPAKIISIKADSTRREAHVKVAGDQLSLAIGKGGQNVRLAARLTGWKIDIQEDKTEKKEKENKEEAVPLENETPEVKENGENNTEEEIKN